MVERIILVSLSSAFETRNDLGFQHSSDNSFSIHMNLFRTLDHVPGNQVSGAWDLYDKETSEKLKDNDVVVLNENPHMKGFLGERKMHFSKSEGMFLNKKQRQRVDQLTTTNCKYQWPCVPSPKLCRMILKHQGIKIQKN